MNHYRFIAKSTNDTNDNLIAFVAEARDRGHAQASARYRFSEDHEVVSVNIKDGDQWRVIEGVSVLADSLKPHTDMDPGMTWEGSAEQHEHDTPTPVRQPVKRPGFYSQDMHLSINSADPLTEDLLTRAEALPADKNPAIVNLLFIAFTTTLLLSVGLFFEQGSEMGARAAFMSILTTMGWPLLALLVSGFALRYLAGSHNTLRRMELRKLAEAAQPSVIVSQAAHSVKTRQPANAPDDNKSA